MLAVATSSRVGRDQVMWDLLNRSRFQSAASSTKNLGFRDETIDTHLTRVFIYCSFNAVILRQI